MDMLSGERITAAALADWRKGGQGLHARFVIRDFRAGVRFLSAIGEAGEAAGHHPEVRMGTAYVDLKLISDDANLPRRRRHPAPGRVGDPTGRRPGPPNQ